MVSLRTALAAGYIVALLAILAPACQYPAATSSPVVQQPAATINAAGPMQPQGTNPSALEIIAAGGVIALLACTTTYLIARKKERT